MVAGICAVLDQFTCTLVLENINVGGSDARLGDVLSFLMLVINISVAITAELHRVHITFS